MHNGTVSDLTPENGNYSVSVIPRGKLVNRVSLSWGVGGGLHQKLSGKVNLHLNWSAITSTLCNTQNELYVSVLPHKKTGTWQNIHLNHIYNIYLTVIFWCLQNWGGGPYKGVIKNDINFVTQVQTDTTFWLCSIISTAAFNYHSQVWNQNKIKSRN